MINIGAYNQLKAARQASFGYYLTDGSENVLLPNKYVPADLRVGDDIRVFVYTDSEDRPLATTIEPKALVGEIAPLKATDVNRFGAFLDWGLEKDLFVPFSEQLEKMIPGHTYCVRVMLDKLTNRVIGTSKLKKFLLPAPADMRVGWQFESMVVRVNEIGADIIVAGKYQGRLYASEIFSPLRVGDRLKTYVKKVREDGRLDMSLQPSGYPAVFAEASATVLKTLEDHDGFIAVTDKTSPAEIEKIFQMSKKTFKKAIGGLYKQRVIAIDEKGISLRRQDARTISAAQNKPSSNRNSQRLRPGSGKGR